MSTKTPTSSSPIAYVSLLFLIIGIACLLGYLIDTLIERFSGSLLGTCLFIAGVFFTIAGILIYLLTKKGKFIQT